MGVLTYKVIHTKTNKKIAFLIKIIVERKFIEVITNKRKGLIGTKLSLQTTSKKAANVIRVSNEKSTQKLGVSL